MLECGRLGRRVVEARFDGGSMTSDAGVMLLSKVDQHLGLLAAAARCIADPRSPLLITHAVYEMRKRSANPSCAVDGGVLKRGFYAAMAANAVVAAAVSLAGRQ